MNPSSIKLKEGLELNDFYLAYTMTKAKQLFADFGWNIEFDSMIGGLVVQDLRVNITLSLERIDKWLTPKTKESLMKDLDRIM